jgi:hypothetical protein
MRSSKVNGREGEESGSIIGRWKGGELGRMRAGEGDEILIAKVGGGFGAGDEENVGAGAETRGNELVSNDGLSVSCAADAVNTSKGIGWGEDCRENGGRNPSVVLLGVDGAAIVLILVDGGVVKVVGHGVMVSSGTLRVFMLVSEFLR